MYLSSSIWLISLNMAISSSMHVAANGIISFSFHGWVIFHGLFGPYLHTHCFLSNLFVYWSIIALQNFVVFCQTSTWSSHGCTYLPTLLNLPPTSLPIPNSRLTKSPCLSFLSQTANSCWLSIFHMVLEVSMSLSPYSSPSPPLSSCPYVCPLCLFVNRCPVNKFFSTIFLDSVYVR